MKRLLNIAYLILGVAIGVLIGQTFAGNIRFEAAFGQCQHRLASDTNWHYELGGYQTNADLNPNCGQVSALWKIDRTFGLRAAYVDLGVVRANNSYPTDEMAYVHAKEQRIGIDTTTEFLQGNGRSRGFTLGPAIEANSGAVVLGVEAGAAYLYNYWHVMDPLFDHWDYADGWNTTWYVGANARYRSVMAMVRFYKNVHASNPLNGPLAIGMTTGPVVQTLVGVSF